MNTKKLGQEPAFSGRIEKQENINGIFKYVEHPQVGMSKRLYAACAAMQGILASYPHYEMPTQQGIKICVSKAYELADELLKQENEEGVK